MTPECVFCGYQKATTRDHVPPKAIFLPPLPTDLVTVPACAECNGSSKLDDEYFRACVATQGFWTPKGARLWEQKVVGSTFRRSERFRKMLAKKIVDVPNEWRRGDLPGGERAILFEKDRINRVLQKIVFGLYWHCQGRRLPPNVSIEVFKDVPPNDDLRTIFHSLPPRSIGGTAFQYRFGVAVENGDVSMWFLIFYEKTAFVVVTGIQTDDPSDSLS